MREFLTLSNFWKASILGGVMTLLSVPRIIMSGMPVHLFVPCAFAAMTSCAGAAFAWGNKGGMNGLFPVNKRMMSAGIMWGLFFACIAIPAYLFVFDPIVINTISARGDTKWLMMKYPPDVYGRLALILWSASFETMFFKAGAMSFFARVTGRQWMVILLGVIFRVFVSALQLSMLGISEFAIPLLAGSAVVSLMACFLFVRYGLPAVMVLSVLIELRLFLISL